MLNIFQIAIGISLVTVIVLQAKSGGLGSAFGGGGDYHTKRGAEKSLFYLTIFLSVTFILIAFFNSIGN